MKKVLLQLDTEEHPSPFDAIVAHDAGVDVLLSHSGVKAESARALAQDAFFTRGSDDLKNTAVWVGGKNVAAGEEIFDEVQKAFFGPFRVSVMIDSNGCNTTAATTIARIAKARDLRRRPRGRDRRGSRGSAVGDAAAGEGCEVTVATLPPDLFGGDRPYRTPARPRESRRSSASTSTSRATAPSSRGCSTGRRSSCQPGPPACRCCGSDFWAPHPTIELLADYNAAEPLGIEGTEATDDMKDYDGKLVLGALAIGGPKMKVHKACVRRLFETNEEVLDTDAVYEIAKELV